MHRVALLINTLRYLKPIQVLARLWNKVPRRGVASHRLQAPHELHPRVAFPEYYRSWDGKDTFTFLNDTHRVSTAADWNNPLWKKLWLYNLHYFDCLRQEGEGADAVGPAIGLMRRWIRENSVGCGNGWEPYPVSLRIVNWAKFLLRLRTSGYTPSAVDLAEIETSLAIQVRWLRKRLEYHLLANHLLANAKALVFAGWYFGGCEESRGSSKTPAATMRGLPKCYKWEGPASSGPQSRRFCKNLSNENGDREAGSWLRKGFAIYERELLEQVLDDGVHFERSAMYHAIILEDLLDCYNILGADIFRDYALRMLSGLQLLTGPDGSLALFNDAAEGISLTPAALRSYASSLGIAPHFCGAMPNAESGKFSPLSTLQLFQPSTLQPENRTTAQRLSGYVRLEAGEWTLIAKCGDIGPDYQPGHAHADSLSFELWKGTRKIITDTGTDRYVVDEERKRQRGTAAHNTILIDGKDSSEVWAGHRVARRARSRIVSLSETELVAECHDCNGFLLRRSLMLTQGGLSGIDEIISCGTGRKRPRHTIESRFHFEPATDDIRLSYVEPKIGLEEIEEDCQLSTLFARMEKGRCRVFRTIASLPFRLGWRLEMWETEAE